MSKKMCLFVCLAVGLAVSIPISSVFYWEIGFRSQSVKLLVTICAVGVFLLAAYLMRTQIRHLTVTKLFAVLLATAFGIFLGAALETRAPSADYATVGNSDGSHTEYVKPSDIRIWGKSVGGYYLHPPFASVLVPNSLAAIFPSNPAKVRILFSKPNDALFLPNGAPTISDGISVQANIFNSDGKIEIAKTYVISQKEFLENRWFEKEINVRTGISKIEIIVSTGLPGSTPDYDSTVVAFEIIGAKNFLILVGKSLLIGLSFFCIALFSVLSVMDFSFAKIPLHTSYNFTGKLKEKLPHFSFLLLVSFIAYWSARKTSFVYFWDYRNYWQKTESLHELMASGAWRQAIDNVLTSLSADYSMLPAVFPALISLVTGYPSRINYLLTITIIYAVPTYIMVAYLAKQLLEGNSASQLRKNRSLWILAGIPVLFGFPLYFGITLYLMPDIGGVILFIAALVQASALMKAITKELDNKNSWAISVDILRSSLALGMLFSLMFLFRRWYVFAAAGIAFASIALLLIETWVKRRYWGVIAQRSAASLVLIVFAALPFLSSVLFDWSQDIGKHDYSNLYSSYKFPLNLEFSRFVSVFGVVAPALCTAFLIFFRKRFSDQRLLFILVVSSLVASILFLLVQSPGRHHYYLLMPLLGASLAAFSITLFRHFGSSPVILLTTVLILGSGSATWMGQGKNIVGYLFPQYTSWLPKQQPFAKGFEEVAYWLLRSENKEKKFCVIASSAQINQGIFSELWQILPNVKKNTFSGRHVSLGEVDSVNGAPIEAIRQCDISLVGSPVQTHLRDGEQYSVEIVQQELVDGTGIGAAFSRSSTVFLLDEHTKILAYERTREITDDEYAGLVERFLAGKKLQADRR